MAKKIDASDKDDRIMTEAEYNEFVEFCDWKGLEEENRRLNDELLFIQDHLAEIEKKCLDYKRYIQVMEHLHEERNEKVKGLERALERLEAELLKLR